MDYAVARWPTRDCRGRARRGAGGVGPTASPRRPRARKEGCHAHPGPFRSRVAGFEVLESGDGFPRPLPSFPRSLSPTPIGERESIPVNQSRSSESEAVKPTFEEPCTPTRSPAQVRGRSRTRREGCYPRLSRWHGQREVPHAQGGMGMDSRFRGNDFRNAFRGDTQPRTGRCVRGNDLRNANAVTPANPCHHSREACPRPRSGSGNPSASPGVAGPFHTGCTSAPEGPEHSPSVPSGQSVGSVETASGPDLVRGSPSGLLHPVRNRSVK